MTIIKWHKVIFSFFDNMLKSVIGKVNLISLLSIDTDITSQCFSSDALDKLPNW